MYRALTLLLGLSLFYTVPIGADDSGWLPDPDSPSSIANGVRLYSEMRIEDPRRAAWAAIHLGTIYEKLRRCDLALEQYLDALRFVETSKQNKKRTVKKWIKLYAGSIANNHVAEWREDTQTGVSQRLNASIRSGAYRYYTLEGPGCFPGQSHRPCQAKVKGNYRFSNASGSVLDIRNGYVLLDVRDRAGEFNEDRVWMALDDISAFLSYRTTLRFRPDGIMRYRHQLARDLLASADYKRLISSSKLVSEAEFEEYEDWLASNADFLEYQIAINATDVAERERRLRAIGARSEAHKAARQKHAALDQVYFEYCKDSGCLADYLRNYPYGSYRDEAIAEIDRAAMKEASRDGEAALARFIEANSRSPVLEEAHDLLDKLRFDRALRSVSGLESFLEEYPESPRATRARSQLDDKIFRRASSSGEIEAYRDYLRRFPQGSHALAARSSVEFLEAQAAFTEASSQDTKTAYLDFLNRFPNSAFSQGTRARVALIEILDEPQMQRFDRFFRSYHQDGRNLISQNQYSAAVGLLFKYAEKEMEFDAYVLLFDETTNGRHLLKAAELAQTRADENALAPRMPNKFFTIDGAVSSSEGELNFSVIPLIAQNNTRDRNISVPFRSQAVLGRYEIRVRLDAVVTNSVEYSGLLVRDRTEYEDIEVSREATATLGPGQLKYLNFRFETTAYKGGILQPDTRFYSIKSKSIEIVDVFPVN